MAIAARNYFFDESEKSKIGAQVRDCEELGKMTSDSFIYYVEDTAK